MRGLDALKAFCSSVLKHWGSLCTGGVLVAMLGGIERFTGVSIPWPIYALAMGAAFIVACFRAFQDQYTEASNLRVDLSNALRLQKNDQDWKSSYDVMRQMHENSARELAALRDYIGPEHPFTLDKRRKLIACLQSIPVHQRFELHISFPSMGGGGAAANKMAEAFRESGWSVTVASHLLLRAELTGICIGCADRAWEGEIPLPEHAETLMHVLTTAEIGFDKVRPGGDEQDDHFAFIVCANP